MEINGVGSIVHELNELVMEELKAQNKYSALIRALTDCGHNIAVLERLKEILDDEIQHTGSLLYIITELDNHIETEMRKGAEGV